MKAIAIGVDIGGTSSKFGIVDIGGKIINKSSIPTKGYGNEEKFIKKLCDELKLLLKKLDFEYELKGIGIGAPNGNFYKGTVEFAPNLEEWNDMVCLADLVKGHLNVPTLVTNDANAGALGEMLYGGAKNMNDFIYITLGTGLGSGIVSNGKMIYGHDGFAGEFGHTIVKKGGRECGCKRRGCLETYASATGITRTAVKLMCDSTQKSTLRSYNFKEIDSEKIYDAAKKGDKLALKAFDVTAEILGAALADAVAYFSPEAVFLFGGLANAGDLLLKPVKEYMEENLLNIFKNKVKILPSKLKSGNAAILGASALVWAEV